MKYTPAIVVRVPGTLIPRLTLSTVLSPPLPLLFVDIGVAVTEMEADVLEAPCAADEAGYRRLRRAAARRKKRRMRRGRRTRTTRITKNS